MILNFFKHLLIKIFTQAYTVEVFPFLEGKGGLGQLLQILIAVGHLTWIQTQQNNFLF